MKNNAEERPVERTSVALTPGLSRRLMYEARRTGRSASAVVRDALTGYFAQAGESELPSFVGMGAVGRGIAARAEEEIAEMMDDLRAEVMGQKTPGQE